MSAEPIDPPDGGQRMSLRTKAERRQKRLTQRRQEAIPLFVAAGIADQVQPIPEVSEIEAWYRRQQADVCATVLRMRRDSVRDWVQRRALAAEYITPDQIARLEALSRRIFRDNLLHRAGFWRGFLGAVGLHSRLQAIEGGRFSGEKRIYWHGAYLNLATGEWESGDYGMAKD